MSFMDGLQDIKIKKLIDTKETGLRFLEFSEYYYLSYYWNVNLIFFQGIKIRRQHLEKKVVMDFTNFLLINT